MTEEPRWQNPYSCPTAPRMGWDAGGLFYPSGSAGSSFILNPIILRVLRPTATGHIRGLGTSRGVVKLCGRERACSTGTGSLELLAAI